MTSFDQNKIDLFQGIGDYPGTMSGSRSRSANPDISGQESRSVPVEKNIKFNQYNIKINGIFCLY